ncbi:unnamed protein product [Phytomonas sp. Hart1]|nr:unnamed protein product [Phytomonas sp. Hart1]|eukprot:CCW70760.1 unnamed protein product [Phytomonas sp. isolate Hart1]
MAGGSAAPFLPPAEAERLREKEAEVERLLAELLPTKARLLEYMAVVDRLGLTYPFPPHFEGAARVRVRALTKPRAEKAPKEVTSPPDWPHLLR